MKTLYLELKQRLKQKLKQKKAMTLMELMVVLAAVIVLLSISMPMIANWERELNMAELDNAAKTIFLEAQHQLAVKKAAGGLDKMKRELPSDRFLTQKPADFSGNEADVSWQGLCYITKSDSITETLIPVQSHTYQMEGNYLIELEPDTGEIYGVFYWKSNETIDYARDVLAIGDGRSVKARTPSRIGYYGGWLSGGSVLSNFTLDQKVDLINNEELYVKLSYKYSSKLLSNYRSALQITMTVEDEHAHQRTWEWKPGELDELNFRDAPGRLECYFLLDSMESGKSFSDIASGSSQTFGGSLVSADNLVPGDDLTITVTSNFSQDQYHGTETSTTKGNSLFEKRTNVRSELGIATETAISISKVRHLRNLDAAYYTHENPNDHVSILLADTIDFEGDGYVWKNGRYDESADCPVPSLRPIKNAALFQNTGIDSDTTVVSGAGFVIKNLVIESDEADAGIFAQAEHVTFSDVRIEDITVDARTASNVGALVGVANNSTIKGCGVYLSTYRYNNGNKEYYYKHMYPEGAAYENEMVERCALRAVFGAEQVGGLIGAASGTVVEHSFAAIKVEGDQTVGGLIGYTDGVTIANSYSSGEIYGNENGSGYGGFIGSATRTEIKNAYSTSNLYVPKKAGGFLGTSAEGKYTSCISYGEVNNTDNTGVPVSAGAFIAAEHSAGDNYSACSYLTQQGYNTSSTFTKPNAEGLNAQGYGTLVASPGQALVGDRSIPYDDALMNKGFPFTPVTSHHYGNWPVQYVINHSLVYYEKYADGTYGYYCETRLMSRAEVDQGETNKNADNYIWVLDSLEDRECVEDGYALLSMYRLTSFRYDLHVGSVTDASIKGRTLQVVDAYGENQEDGQSVRLRRQGALEFKAYAEQQNDYSGIEPEDGFSISGMYLYQLPYSLQCTARSGVDNFYDRIIIYNGFAKGNDTAPVLGGASAEEGVSFFYCPHFAKTAINPNTKHADQTTVDNPPYVYVRSARQLNALGRNRYYWNDKQGYTGKINYVQETDINFSSYTNGTKQYCGKPFDLTDMDGPVKNVVIGLSDNATNGNYAAQFKNNYDGQGHKVIDFCLKTSAQFAGLFGEIRDAKIENVVMTVSKGGIITSNFRNGGRKAGVGALLGLAFGTNNTISSCSAVGYQVEYDLDQPVGGLGMGGLIGFSMSNVNNCMAANDVLLKANCKYDNPVFLGGLAGSAFFNKRTDNGSFYYSLENCYAGGTINIKKANEDCKLTGEAAIGGVCPGYLYTWNDIPNKNGSYRNLYSDTEILVTGNSKYLFGTIGNLTVSGEKISSMTFDGELCYLNREYADKVSTGEEVKEQGRPLDADQWKQLPFVSTKL